MAASTNTQRTRLLRALHRQMRLPSPKTADLSISNPIPHTDRQGALRQRSRRTGTRLSSEAGDPPLGRTRPTGDPDGANLNLTIGTAVLDPVSGTASHRSYLREIRRTA